MPPFQEGNRGGLFSVKSPYQDRSTKLCQQTWVDHIEPFKGQQGVTVPKIQNVILGCSEAFLDRSNANRHLLFSDAVVNDRGKRMMVVVEIKESPYEHEVVTAFFNRNPKTGDLIWQANQMTGSAVEITSSYDSVHDVMYIAKASSISVEDEEIEDGIFFSYSSDEKVVGATLFHYKSRDPSKLSASVAKLATDMSVTSSLISTAFDKAVN